MNLGAGDFLTPLQAEKHPHFASLLKDLCNNKLASDCSSKTKEESKKRELKDYTKAKEKHNTLKLIVECIWEIISDPSSDDNMREELEESFLTSEMHTSMKISNEDGFVRPFGLGIQPTPLNKDTQSKVQELLRKKLTERGITMLQMLGSDVEGNNKELLAAKLNQLPNLISSRLEENQALEKAYNEKKHALKEQRSKYTSSLLDSLQILEELVLKHLIQLQNEQYQVNAQWIKVQCDALLLKIKSLHLEILCETYSKETSPALHSIWKQLSANTDQTEADIEASKARLNRYESVGQDFNQLVAEYAQLREAIKQKKWTLEKLKTYCN